tara:strand:- start:1583 stop:2005 length:423 start_codon:yes stop_codon:yes gene_type:complete
MNIGRLIISVIAVLVAKFGFDAIYHGMLLGDSDKETAEAWRPEAEMMALYQFKIGYDLLIAIGICTVWAFGFAGKGIKCGAIYGFLIGLTVVGGMLISFIFTPIPEQFMMPWALGGMFQSIIVGMIVALVYKGKPKVDEA